MERAGRGHTRVSWKNDGIGSTEKECLTLRKKMGSNAG
jgi:hypothetical protein